MVLRTTTPVLHDRAIARVDLVDFDRVDIDADDGVPGV
jgi:hypothetical protein